MNEIQISLTKMIGSALFGGIGPSVKSELIVPLIQESKAQAVFPLLFSTIEDQIKTKLSPEEYSKYSEEFLIHSVGGTQNFAEHGELHELMTASDIPYVVIKGLASASYYPDPFLRNMGDVDFLVQKENLQKAGRILEAAGFVVEHGEKDDSIHIAYHRPPMSIWEMHRTVNGIPNSEIGEHIAEEINKVISSSILTEIEDVICRIPDSFHHGIILLLHTASHLTNEGVGLRHLCDWVVFASSFSDTEFRKIFEKKLKSYGLWKFAQILTQLGIRYFGAPKRLWVINSNDRKSTNDKILEELMDDILNGGNFGTKDMNRYRQIKYISDRKSGTVNNSGIVHQAFKALNEKACSDYKIIDSYRILLPFGWIAEGCKYISLLKHGRRKSSGTKQMLRSATERKRVYSSLKLFERGI